MTKSRLLAVATGVAIASLAAPDIAPAQTDPARVTKPMHTNARTQVSVDHSKTRLHVGTPNENQPRYSLSLTKLLIADYVYQFGTPADKIKADDMIIRSNDGVANELAARYPRAIPYKAKQYGMRSAVPAATWGNWKFSSADWSRYLSAKHREDPTATGRLLTAMRRSTTHGADGYNQRYGVALLPGVQGWKSGWSDDRRTFHASAGFGNGWSVAVQTTGRSSDLNYDLFQALRSGEKKTPAAPKGMTNYPARQVARNAVTDMQKWVNQNGGSVDVSLGASPVINSVPEYILLPTPVAQALPKAR